MLPAMQADSAAVAAYPYVDPMQWRMQGLWISSVLFFFSPVTVSKDSIVLSHIKILHTYMAENWEQNWILIN